MKITPLPNQVYLKLEKEKVGALDTSSRQSAVEYGKVLAIGETNQQNVTGTRDSWGIPVLPLQVGDHVFVKAWAIDSVTKDGVRYDFVNIGSGGILAKAE